MRRLYVMGILGAMLLVLASCGQQILGAAVKEQVDKTLPLEAGGSFALENVNGDIKVTLGKPGEVRIHADKTVRALDEAQAKESLSRLEVAITAAPGHISVETRYPKPQGIFSGIGPSGSVDYTVQIPPGTSLTLTNVNGAISVEAPGCDVSCETTNGHLGIAACDALKAATVNGHIEFKAQNVDEVSSTNGHIEGALLSLKPLGGKIETVNGHVTLTLPAGIAVRIEAENVHGDVASGFPGVSEDKHTLSGDLNGGGKTLSIETVNGSIEVKRGR